jgi:hypothetical protein
MRATGSRFPSRRAPGQGGWSLPITGILLLIVVILFLFYGVPVLLWVAGLVVGITLLVWIYDGIARLFPSSKRFSPYGKQCLRCAATSLGQFVHRRRYELRCTECGEVYFHASLARAARKMDGYYEALAVNDDLSRQRVLGKGMFRDLRAQLATESERGGLILLRAEPE